MARIKISYYRMEQSSALRLYYSGLAEKEQRHYLGMEYLRFGKGCGLYLSQFYQTSRQRVIKGYKELILLEQENQIADYTRQRIVGGGAKKKNIRNPILSI